MKPKQTVLFVCTGNVFRSMSANYCLKDFLQKHKITNILTDSAGTIANKEPIAIAVKEKFKELGIDISKHKQKKLNNKMFKSNVFVIAMAKSHKSFIKKNFNKNVPLFMELCYGLDVSLPDVEDVIKNWETEPKLVDKYEKETVQFIHNSIPILFSKLIDQLEK